MNRWRRTTRSEWEPGVVQLGLCQPVCQVCLGVRCLQHDQAPCDCEIWARHLRNGTFLRHRGHDAFEFWRCPNTRRPTSILAKSFVLVITLVIFWYMVRQW